MDPPAQKTPFEQKATEAYRILTQLRMQSAMTNGNLGFCFNRCLDTDELYTLFRSQNAPISYRLKKDMEEKKCIQHCSSKWNDLFPLVVSENNERLVYEVQSRVLQDMMRAMSQGAPA